MTPDTIILTVARHFCVTTRAVRGRRRIDSYANARAVAMHAMRRHLKMSYTSIGKQFGGRDHSTVMSACRKVDKWLESPTMSSWFQRSAVEVFDRSADLALAREGE